jgi:class 3 adenylate cyclase
MAKSSATAGTISQRRSASTRSHRLARFERPAIGHRNPQLYASVAGGRHEPERKIATIMFADVIRSTELSRSIGLESWWSVIGRLFEDMSESVEQFGGWVEGFTGDGIMAVFETPGSSRACEHANRACEAALWLRDVMVACAADLDHAYGVELSVRIGIHSGEVLTGTIGRRHGQHHTAGGYAVALAKRIETLAAPGTVYLSEHTAAYVGLAQELRDLGTFSVKGARAPVHVFELISSR